MSLRTKFLLALIVISAFTTTAVLLVVRARVQVRASEELVAALDNSVSAFDHLQQQRDFTLERSAALLAALPTLKAVMTSEHAETIQDASDTFWRLGGSQIFVLTDRQGTISAFHSATPEFPREAAQAAIGRYRDGGSTRDWWYGGGHLYQVFLQPISLGGDDTGYPIGLLAVGYEVNRALASDISDVASSEVAFTYDRHLVVHTVGQAGEPELARLLSSTTLPVGKTVETQLGPERFLTRTVSLATTTPPVTLVVLKSLDETNAFLESLNRYILGIGVAGILVGSLLVFLVSTTFTRPLGRLVAGVKALERGDYTYPLDARGGDEVSTLTRAFDEMRAQQQITQQRLIDAERLATIGHVASTISHDLRHPLTAIQAYAEFLAERDLSEEKRQDYFQEIRLAVEHMTDELNGFLGFTQARQPLQRVDASLNDVIDRAIRTVKATPEFDHVTVTATVTPGCVASFDPGKLERAIVNLVLNAAEAAPPAGGRVDVSARLVGVEVNGRPVGEDVEIRVADNGPGLPAEVVARLFEPFVTHGKAKGTGLGLSVVQNLLRRHDGSASVEQTGPSGTTFLLKFPLTNAPVS